MCAFSLLLCRLCFVVFFRGVSEPHFARVKADFRPPARDPFWERRTTHQPHQQDSFVRSFVRAGSCRSSSIHLTHRPTRFASAHAIVIEKQPRVEPKPHRHHRYTNI
uniref:Putative secreted peptide n=1 Tax=Anopheles braziliensis TaxID=58242 RepID=A0A2M3ZNI1_9DIPT